MGQCHQELSCLCRPPAADFTGQDHQPASPKLTSQLWVGAFLVLPRFDHKLNMPSVFSVVVDGLPVTDATVELGICPCLFLCLSLFLCPFRKKSKLVHSLVPVAHLLQDRDRRSMCQQEEQLRQCGCLENSNIVQSKRRRKRVVFFVIIMVQNCFSVITSGVKWVVVSLIDVCGFIQVFIVAIIVILNGGEVRVMGTRSRFSAAGVFAFASRVFELSTRLNPSLPCPSFVC